MTGGAPRQQIATGGLSSAPFSLLFKVALLRWVIHTLSWSSIETPIVWPSSASLGSGFGHSGSTSKIGASTIVSCAVAACCNIATPAQKPVTPAASAAPQRRLRLIIASSLSSLSPPDIMKLRHVLSGHGRACPGHPDQTGHRAL